MADEVGTFTVPVILSFRDAGAQANKELGSALGDVGKKVSKDLAKGAQVGLKQLEADVSKAADAYGKLYDKAQDSLGKVKVAEAQLTKARSTGDATRIVAAEEKLATARRNNTRITNEAKSAYAAFEGAQRKLGQGADDLGGKFSGMSGFADKAGTAIAAAGAVAAGAALVGVTALAGGVLAAGNALYDLGAQFDDTFDNIRLKTGATGEELDALQQQTKRLGAVIALPMGEIGDVVAEVNRHLHLTGTEADNVIRAITTATAATGEAVDVKDLGKVFRQFKVETKDQVAVLDQLWGVSQATGISMNDLVDTIIKGGAPLRDLNLDIGQSAAFLSMVQEAGLDTEKSMGGLTKATAYLAKDGKTLNEGLGDLFNQIKTLGEAESIELANKIFGAKQGAAFAEVIRDGTLDVENLTTAVAGTGDTLEAARADTEDWSETWQRFKNQIAAGLQPIGTGVFDAVNGRLTELSEWVTSHQSEVVEFFGRLGDAALDGLSKILQFGAESLRTLADFIRGFDELTKPMFDFMANVGSVLKYVPGFQDMGKAMEFIGEGGQAFNDAVMKTPAYLDATADKLDQVNNTLLPKAKQWWDSIVDRTADALRFSERLGDQVTAIVDKDNQIVLSSNVPEVTADLAELGITVTTLPDGRVSVTANTDEGQRIIEAWRQQQTGQPLPITPQVDTNAATNQLKGWWGSGIKIPAQLEFQAGASGVPTSGQINTAPPRIPGRAAGGVFSNMPKSAVIQPATTGLIQWAEPSTKGEAFIPLDGSARSQAIWAETGKRLGILAGAFEKGGVIDTGWFQQVAGTPYQMGGFGNTFDCSGAVSAGVNVLMGRAWNQGPQGGSPRMSTASEAEWLKSQGFVLGAGPPGAVRVGWVNGGPGGGHTAMTLPNGVNFESTSGKGVLLGGDARGADDSMFTNQAYLPPGPQLMGAFGGAGGGSLGSAGSSGGTRGYGPSGEAGTYQTDPGAVADAEGRVAEADAKVLEAEAKQRELEADAKESQKISAQNDVDSAKRDAADARKKLQEAQQGEFTADSDSSSSNGGGSNPHMEFANSMLKNIGGGLLEGFGLDGSWLPDISNLAPVKMASSLLSAFAGPLQGAIDGKLGIQQPGWQPGMPVGDMQNDTGIGDSGVAPAGSTSFAPFGMPDVQLPDRPRDGSHLSGPGGTPAQPGPVTIEQNQIFNNSQLGWDPVQTQKVHNRAVEQRSVPRLGGFGAGVGK